MPGVKHISEGKCAVYGRTQFGPNDEMQMWRHRLHNERVGIPSLDNTGTNTTVSLMWNPNPSLSPRSAYAMASQKRASELKRMHVFGEGQLARAHAESSYRGSTPRAAAAPRAPPSSAAHASTAAERRGFLDTEGGRLKAATQARNLGQTFLLQGNLQQAKNYLARAEQLLQAGLEEGSGLPVA